MVSNWSLKKLRLIRLTHSCGNCAPTGWSCRKFGAIHSRQARFCETRRRRRCFSAFVGGEGSITSQVSGARFAGSAESKVCKNVVPVRGNPTTKRGARIWCCAISGCRLRSRCSKSRLRRMRRTSERSAMLPITFKRASRQHDSSKRAIGSRKSPSPKSSRLARRFAVSISSSGGMRRLTLPLSIAPNRLSARMTIGGRKRSMVAADCIGRNVPIARSQKQAQASGPVNSSGGISHDKQEVHFQIAGLKKDAGLETGAHCVKFVGQAFLPAALGSKASGSACPTIAEQCDCSLVTACCATHPPVSSLLYGNGKSDLWGRLFLGSGRNLSQIKRCYRYGGRLRRWH